MIGVLQVLARLCVSGPQLVERTRQLGLACVQRLESAVDLALMPTILPALALALHESGDRCPGAEPPPLLIEIGLGRSLSRQGLREDVLVIAHRVQEGVPPSHKVLESRPPSRIIAIDPGEGGDDLPRPGRLLGRAGQQQVPVGVVRDGSEALGDRREVAVGDGEGTRFGVVLVAGHTQPLPEIGEVFVRLAMGQAPLARLERHGDRSIQRAQAPREGLHRHLGGSPSVPHLRQPLRRGIGVVPLEQAGQHLGLGGGVGGDEIGALLDRP